MQQSCLKGTKLLISEKKTTQFFHLFLWNFPWMVFRCLKVTWKPNVFPFADRRRESFITKVAFSFPRNHKNLLKSMYSFASDWQNSHPTGQVNMQILFWLLKTNQPINPQKIPPNPGDKTRTINVSAIAVKCTCVDKVPLPCKAVLETKPSIFSWLMSCLKSVMILTVQPDSYFMKVVFMWLCSGS